MKLKFTDYNISIGNYSKIQDRIFRDFDNCGKDFLRYILVEEMSTYFDDTKPQI